MAESRLLAITFVSGTCKQQNSHLIKFDKMVYVTCGIVFFEDREGKAPVLEWLDSQPDEVRRKAARGNCQAAAAWPDASASVLFPDRGQNARAQDTIRQEQISRAVFL